MHFGIRPLGLILILTCGALTTGTALYIHRLSTAASSPISQSGSDYSPPLDESTYELASGWKLQVLREFPEGVNSLGTVLPKSNPSGDYNGCIFVGTSPSGGVYRVSPGLGQSKYPIALGLGDHIQFGTACVNKVAVHDVDHDGVFEVLASTSQVQPAGNPRLYAWSMGASVCEPRGIARPEIKSNWSHGLAFFPRGQDKPDSLFITFCGYGEIVEYRLDGLSEDEGFQSESIGWKQVGQLPASGEWAQSVDVDNDGDVDLCFATGYAEKMASIHVYTSDGPGIPLRLLHKIEEDGRFGNVRLCVGDLRGDGSNEITAWWITDYLYGGECEMIRYRLDTSGVRERTVVARGPSGRLWPDDGQSTVIDTDEDGKGEVCFSTSTGNLWCYDPEPSQTGNSPTRLNRILKIEGGLGPVAAGRPQPHLPVSLFLGRGRQLLQLDRLKRPVPRAPKSMALKLLPGRTG